jgi:hypothetical protein
MLNANKIFLIQQYYVSDDVERQYEIDNVLQLNLLNQFIDKIYLLNESTYDFSNFVSNDKICQINIGKRLSFSDAITFSKSQRSEGNNDFITIMSNSDIELGLDIGLLHNYSFDNIVYCLTRYDIDFSYDIDYKSDGKKIKHFMETNGGHYMFSQDLWIYKPSECTIDVTNLHFNFGVPACDNAFVCELNKQNINCFNIANEIKILHHHKQDSRNYGTRLQNQIMPCYSILQSDIEQIIKLQTKYNLSATQINYFIGFCNLTNITNTEYETYLRKLIYKNQTPTNDEINFIDKMTKYIQYQQIDKCYQSKYVKFIRKFSHYHKLFNNELFNNELFNNELFNNELFNNAFVSKIISFIYVGKEVYCSNNNCLNDDHSLNNLNVFQWWKKKNKLNLNCALIGTSSGLIGTSSSLIGTSSSGTSFNGLSLEWANSFNELNICNKILL